MKICKECQLEKELSEFYPTQGECKECTKKRVKLRTEKLKSDPVWVEKERERHREKYRRLNYKDKQKKWDEAKTWKNSSAYKNLSRKFKTSKGIELHHWNYNDKYLEDVFVLKTSQHRKAHKNLVFDLESKIFKTLKGEVLDTKEKHKNYLVENGIEFEN